MAAEVKSNGLYGDGVFIEPLNPFNPFNSLQPFRP